MAAVDAWIHDRLGRTWRFGSTTPSQVRRSLFGPVDHQENSRFLKEEIEKQNQEDNRRWNFDFLSEVPLVDTGKGDHRYQWSPVRTGDDDDAALPEMRHNQDIAKPEDSEVEENTDISAEENTSNELQKITKQTHITDYMRKRKSSFPGNKSEISSSEPPIKTARRSST